MLLFVVLDAVRKGTPDISREDRILIVKRFVSVFQAGGGAGAECTAEEPVPV